jgi:hypothetical protein
MMMIVMMMMNMMIDIDDDDYYDDAVNVKYTDANYLLSQGLYIYRMI